MGSVRRSVEKRRGVAQILTAALCFLLIVGGGSALADDPDDQIGALPTSVDISAAIEQGGPGTIPLPATDPSAAEQLPHQDLGRAEALELLEGVFAEHLESPAGIFDDLEVERFLAPDIAVISQPEPADSGLPADGEVANAALLDSTVPFRTESISGQAEAVDLSLERTKGEIQPANPLAEVEIPELIGEGIALSDSGVTIDLADAPEGRATSIIDQSVGFIPNVAKDTDLVIAPTVTGVETLTHLRSPDAPRAQTFELQLPAGAILKAIEGGGAVVVAGANTLVNVSPPTAIDATGKGVPVSLDVEGTSLILTTSPTPSTQFPVLVDPLYQTYEWAKSKWWQSGIFNNSHKSGASNSYSEREEWGEEYGSPYTYGRFRLENQAWSEWAPVPMGTPGLWIDAYGPMTAGERGSFIYTVPRYFTDYQNYEERPTSYISNMTLSNLDWNANSTHASPYMFAGIWNPVSKNWLQFTSQKGLVGHGLSNMSHPYPFSNPGGAGGKVAYVSVQATEPVTNGDAELYVGNASIQLSDNDVPSLTPAIGPTKWVDQTALPIEFTASDTGLGVHALVAADQASPSHSWKTSHGCIGVGGSPCPFEWKSTAPGSPQLKYDPAVMPQGINHLSIVAEDPVGNKASSTLAQVKVDHSTPTLSLSGTLTEQAKVGITGTQYTLKYSAADGDSAAPAALTPFGIAGIGEGKMQRPVGVAVGASGNAFVVDRECKCVQKYDSAGKFVSQFGTAGSGNGQFLDPRGIAISAAGNVLVSDLANKNVQIFNASGGFIRKVTYGEFIEPYAVATAPGSTLWVSDIGKDKVFKFKEGDGSLLSVAYGSSANPDAAPTGLLSPVGLATDSSSGNLWVTDNGLNRVTSFSSAGKYVHHFGGEGTGNGQFKGPIGVAVAPSGHLLVADDLNNRIQVFQSNGSYLRQFGTVGAANNQVKEPRGIALAPDNRIYIADAGNKRIASWSHADLNPQSGVARAEIKVDGKVTDIYSPGCTTQNCSINNREWTLQAAEYPVGQHTLEVTATDAVGRSATQSVPFETRVVTPTLALSGSMVEQASLGTRRPRYKLKLDASAETGVEGEAAPPAYISTFGTYGTADGQFKQPAGIARAADGTLWVVDHENNRVQHFDAKGKYLGKFGSFGTGNGQFDRPVDIEVDVAGNLWVADAGNDRVQKFSSSGTYLSKFGSHGSATGKFDFPEGIAIDTKGNVWVSDTRNHRIQKFNAAGGFLKSIGSFGTGQGQLREPSGIDVGPGGGILVADWENNRVVVFNEEGVFQRQFGIEGEGPGQFRNPVAIDVDSSGYVWVSDERNERIEQFDQAGNFITQFGTEGSGAGEMQLTNPMGLVTGPEGRIWVADSSNDRVQEWKVPDVHITYVSTFGATGTGNGQFNQPAGIARAADGTFWVADADNHRVQHFSATGAYLGKFGAFGTGNGQFNKPTDLEIDGAGNIYVADTRNHRIQKFNSVGTYVSKFGAVGTGNGQFQYPEGLAIDKGGNLWVADTVNNRLQKFSSAGTFLKAVGSFGSGQGQLYSPMGIDVGPGGGILVADWDNNRVVVFNEEGVFQRQFGIKGYDEGEFDGPVSIEVDANGLVLVSDEKNERVEQFDQAGNFITQFGTEGSGAGEMELTNPMGIVTGPEGKVWITDSSNDRVQEWRQSKSVSEVFTEISVDGSIVDSGQVKCAGERCPITREWVLDSLAYSPGNHVVIAKVTDGLGLVRSKSFTINIQRDTTKPSIQANGALFDAPEGWVDQKTYGLNVTAEDGGFGVTSLALRIDGVKVAESSQSCADGACKSSLVKSVDVSSYSGGAHPAELVATDGAGNSVSKHWTINVNPDGQITVTEAIATLDAADVTGEATIVAPTSEVLEAEQIEYGDNPGWEVDGSTITSTGTQNSTTMTVDPADGFVIDSPRGEVTIEPDVDPGASNISITEGVAGVSANIAAEVDSVIRPEYNGVQTFQAIHSLDSPTGFSWTVKLAPGQIMRSANNSQVEVMFEDGVRALLITAQQAHDATGVAVPTSLEVSGNILTLHVHLGSGNYVYPIMAGQGWEASYNIPTFIAPPEDDAEIKQREKEEREEWEAELLGLEPPAGTPPPSQPPLNEAQAKRAVKARMKESGVAPPPLPANDGASISKVRTFTTTEHHVCQVDNCALWKIYIRNPSFIRGFDWVKWEPGTQLHCGYNQDWVYQFMIFIEEQGCDFRGSSKVWKGGADHLTVWSRFEIWTVAASPLHQERHENNVALQIWVWPNGYQQNIVRHYDPLINEL